MQAIRIQQNLPIIFELRRPQREELFIRRNEDNNLFGAAAAAGGPPPDRDRLFPLPRNDRNNEFIAINLEPIRIEHNFNFEEIVRNLNNPQLKLRG